MSNTTVGFIGQRLTEARAARGMSAVTLSDLLKVSPQSISKYENGHQSPKPSVLTTISRHLDFPVSYFTRKPFGEESFPVFWRGRLSAPVGMQDRAKVRLTWLTEIINYLNQFFDFPILSLPEIPVGEIDLVDANFMDSTATAIRKSLGLSLGPLPDMIEKLEDRGVFVSRIHVRADKLDAFSRWSDVLGLPLIVLGRDKSSAVRQRFDLLHELSHLIIHKNINQTTLNKKASYKAVEKQADMLASTLLLPEKEFLDELYSPSLDGFLALKERWGVSVGAMIMRSKSLGVVTDDQYSRLWINYNRRGWRKNEPLDGKIRKEEPHLIRRSFELLISEKVQSVSEIKAALPFPLEDLEEVCDLEKGFLGGATDSRAEPMLKSLKSSSNVIAFGKS